MSCATPNVDRDTISVSVNEHRPFGTRSGARDKFALLESTVEVLPGRTASHTLQIRIKSMMNSEHRQRCSLTMTEAFRDIVAQAHTDQTSVHGQTVRLT